ncbi:PREDICTED: Golgi-specific brefeldin A-resistance guanine nucleotide exchange factor 1 [Nicrophorus vespilloides]|uniref:Golgi-specific brefeldin A-resistance guanine nucleotide exchange factor 1 n=1 Tax=Nicrophorus vespilloides TaxID=110193 RepID=A0ABM1NFI1_NICVS|nr:PREDICTED: Golgi-specific brefeldin A-resistance guanine nucleotide exchange factor 1 [Nicrophorus vespilloides]
MSLPGNGIFVVKGEMSILLTAMRRGNNRWSSHHHHQDDDQDPLVKAFQDLKEVLNRIDDLRLIDPIEFLGPFLEVIRSEDTTGPVTSLSLSAVNKFLSYGLIDPTHSSIPLTVHSIADAVTHARFVGTDHSSDGVVLMKILQVLKTLTLSPEGASLTNESLCDIMLSCFKICFETRLSDLLRRTAEHYLKDMIQLVFMRLPQFPEVFSANFKQLKMRPGTMVDHGRVRKKSLASGGSSSKLSYKTTKPTKTPVESKPEEKNETETQTQTSVNILDMQGSISNQIGAAAMQCDISVQQQQKDEEQEVTKIEGSEEKDDKEDAAAASEQNQQQQQEDSSQEEYINQRGIRFTQQHPDDIPALVPYGLGCVYELFRFLISLCNPLDKQNTDVMIHLGLTLLTTAFEVGADSIGKYTSLMSLVKDELCRNMFSLLGTERLSVFAADLQVCFLMFEALRTHLKFQLEFYLGKLVDIIVSDSPKVTYEYKELALDNILNLWMIPGFTAELYLNYDCNMYCTNLYEDLTKLLAKNTFPAAAAGGGVYNTHLLSLDALLTVVESVEAHCVAEDKQEAAVAGAGAEEEIEEGSRSIENIRDLIGKDSLSNRRKVSENIPKREELLAIKDIKKWLPTGTEHFNHKPKKGIQFLQEHGVLKSQLDANEVCAFLRENPALDKKMIGEFISGRNNLQVLEAFVKMFDFNETRIDEALRLYLETFRLPGEAPLISLILEQFAEHWHKCNGEPFANADAAFTLAYAVIMLNVDQHNHNVKRQNNPMTPEEFKKNLKKVNGGNDFEQDMLDEMYNAIRNDEIVMPAEQTGLVRENYLWKVLLRRGASKDGNYVHVASAAYDVDLFNIIWGPIVAALSFVFDKSEDTSAVCKKALQQGFARCAAISSHFGMTDKLDILMATLSKYTLLHGGPKTNGITNVTVHLGANDKAQMALRIVFTLAHQYGSGIREGWKNLFDMVLSLYSLNLLPKAYTEAEDFIEGSGKISLVYENVQQLQKQDTGLLSSLYSYMVSSENISRIPSAEEQVYIDRAIGCIGECGLEQVITDSKFLDEDALNHLIRALIDMSRGPDVEKAYTTYNENVAVFFLELLVKVVLQNRDRVMIIWQTVRDHLYTLMMNASHFDYQFLLERSVIGLLRLAIRLMRNEEMSPVVLQSMRMLLMLKGFTLHRISRQISFGLYELLKTSAQNIHTNTDWSIVFTLLECVGAGAQPPKPIVDETQHTVTKSDGESSPGVAEEESPNSLKERGYTSDSELNRRSQSPLLVPGTPQNGGGWILVGNEGEVQPVLGRTLPAHQYSLALEIKLGPHDPIGLVKCCESLAFLVRDVAHITPYNFDDCVHCIRTFVEASLRENKTTKRVGAAGGRDSRMRRKPPHRKLHHRSPASSPDSQEQSDDEDIPGAYHQVTIQLLDLMHTLHTRTAQIFRWWAEEGGEVAQQVSLWTQGWCPLLQGIARLCCDNRKQIRMSAITYLQRALLVHDLQTLNGPEWEACFNRVLFPLLDQLLRPICGKEQTSSLEETRMRAATVLSKVFLHHLTPLLSLATFPQLWLTILDYMDKYMHADRSDLLAEAIPESLKNMLLVMESAGVFEGAPDSQLWTLTWDRMATFLPHMKEELFREKEQASNVKQQQEYLQQQQLQDAVKPPVNTSPLFVHLGQMVSTPIGPPTTQEPQESSPNHHTFPILYTPQMEPPVSLYSEYMGNPYNLPTLDNSMPTFQAPLRDNETDLQNDGRNVDGGDPKLQTDLVDSNCNPTTIITTTTTQQQQQQQPPLPPPSTLSTSSSANLFQSGHYFCGEQTQVPGAEILFGSNNIPILTTESNTNNKYM